mgnify:FL=1
MSEFIEILDCKSSRVILNTRDIVRVGEHRDGCAITVIAGNAVFTVITPENIGSFRSRLFSENKAIPGASMERWRAVRNGGKR